MLYSLPEQSVVDLAREHLVGQLKAADVLSGKALDIDVCHRLRFLAGHRCGPPFPLFVCVPGLFSAQSCTADTRAAAAGEQPAGTL